MRKITLEIELSAPDLSTQKDIDFAREIYDKYDWMIGGMTLQVGSQKFDIKQIEDDYRSRSES